MTPMITAVKKKILKEVVRPIICLAKKVVWPWTALSTGRFIELKNGKCNVSQTRTAIIGLLSESS